jgi:hypothetical protein
VVVESAANEYDTRWLVVCVIFLIYFHNIVVIVAIVVVTVILVLGVARTISVRICHLIHGIYNIFIDLIVVVIHRQVI